MKKIKQQGIVLITGLSLALFLLSAFRQDGEGRASAQVPKAVVMKADTSKKDPDTGLVLDESLMMVKAQCTSCHSSKLITQNRFTRDGWQQKIRWMQANHNLWDLGESEKVVLDYLEKYYAPSPTASGSARRAPLHGIEWYPLKLK
ncbi:hypothetical protein [Telluribacter sp.]|jgi:CxxC motif-containing protein (DUF1111 family)|uniref:hypothetical protein n=1 Tax=Telluribacter sp. TaxID=1978767 RepID=UPI002E0DF489|nr:hypothetical protein [Telluribacter sp.]